MITFRYHIPSCVDCDPIPNFVGTWDELENELKDKSYGGLSDFGRYSINTSERLLMAEMNSGTTWVAGYILRGDLSFLPEFKSKYIRG